MKILKSSILLYLFILFLPWYIKGQENPLEQIQLESPREAMRVFIYSMNQYKKGLKKQDEKLLSNIDNAMRCLNLEDIPYLIRRDKGKEAAIFLKEVIDRIYFPLYYKIPKEIEKEEDKKWIVPKTEIVIALVEEGERKGEYLFTKDTVFRAKEFYNKVKHLPYKTGTGKGAGYSEPWTTKFIPSWMQKVYFFVVLWKWLGFLSIVALGYVVKILSKFLLKFVLYLLQKKQSEAMTELFKEIFESFYSPIGFLTAIGFWFLCLNLFPISGKGFQFILLVLELSLSVVVIWILYKMIDIFTKFLKFRYSNNEHKPMIDLQLLPFMRKTMKVFVVLIGFLVIIQNLGVNVVSIMAGLGIGGLIFAFAAKDTAANLFGSIMILLDRPFKVGDYIVVGNTDGMIEEIGFRTTRIRTFYNSLVSIPNAEVANVKIDNMEERIYRRTLSKIGIPYDTPPEKIEGFLEGIKNIIKANSYTRKDYINASLNGFTEYCLEIFVIFYLAVPSYLVELAEKNNIFLEILRLANDMEIVLAFPTQSIHLETTPDKKKPRRSRRLNLKAISQTAKDFGLSGKKAKPKGFGIFTHPSKE